MTGHPGPLSIMTVSANNYWGQGGQTEHSSVQFKAHSYELHLGISRRVQYDDGRAIR